MKTVKDFNRQLFDELLAEHQPPCVSIYQPLHRASPPADEDHLRLADALEKVEHSLRARYDEKVVRQMAEKIRQIGREPTFWEGDRDAIVIFASPDYLRVEKLQSPVEPLAVVADSFHLKPLIRVVQVSDRYNVLCVETKLVSLYEGNQFRLDRVEMKNVPINSAEVAGMRLSRKVESGQDMIQSSRQANEGPGSGTEAVPLDQFLRAVDKGVWETYSRVNRLPLIFCAVEEYHSLFHSLSRNQYLEEQGIRLDPHRLPAERIRQEAWKIMEPRFRSALDRLTNEFRAAKAHHRGSDELTQVAEAASQGRVGTLLVDGDKHIPGILHPHSGMIEQARREDPKAGDLLDDLAEMVLKTDGQVLVVPHDRMPTETGVAAIYRY